MRCCKRLRSLHLNFGGRRVDVAIVDWLRPEKKTPTLMNLHLTLRDAPLSIADARALGRLVGCLPALTLDLHNTRLNDQAMCAMADEVVVTEPRGRLTMDLSGNKDLRDITPLLQFFGFGESVCLAIRGGSLTRRQKQELQAHCGNHAIAWLTSHMQKQCHGRDGKRKQVITD
jgi:hypothetical protein